MAWLAVGVFEKLLVLEGVGVVESVPDGVCVGVCEGDSPVPWSFA